MPDLFDLFVKWWKQMLAVVLLSVTVVGVITFLKPRQYLSTATAVPGNSYASDKSRIFNENIEGLYTALGSPDDLDLILGTAGLDTVYLAVTDAFNIFDHYKVKEKGEEARQKAAHLLKKNTRVIKSDYGELKVKVWDTDKNLAPQLANAIMDKLKAIHQDLQTAGNETTMKGLVTEKEKLLLQKDSTTVSPEQKAIIITRLSDYEKLISEYKLMISTKPPVLLVVEKAKAALRPDKPRRVQTIFATALLAFIFSIFAGLLLEGRKKITSE